MTKPSDFITPGTIVLMSRGSDVYGTKIDDHDEDLTGVYIGSLKAYFGFGEGDSVEYKKDQYDIVGYEFKKFVRLLIKQNPNGLEALYTPSEFIFHQGTAWEELIEIKDSFLSKRAYDSFSGYAYSQMKRMTRYQDDPEREDIIESLKSEINYRTGMELNHGSGNYARPPYENWKMETLRKKLNDYRGAAHSPGAARKETMEKFGYSVKNATHVIRLLSMGIELLEEGCIFPDRRGRNTETLKEIRRGEWELDQVNEYAETLFKEAREAYNKSKLREKPDHSKIEEFCIETLKEHFNV